MAVVFMFTHFTDRDGKYQLAALAESGFNPLVRTCQFMLTEEAHHMFVGEMGVMRVRQRTCQIIKELGTDNPEAVRAAGTIDLPTMQKFVNLHYSVSVDLFGGEISTNGAAFFTNGLKGRYLETRIKDDHQLTEATWPVFTLKGGEFVAEDQPARLAVNERLRDDYILDSQRGVDRWNKEIQNHGIDFELTLTHRAFNRRIGAFRDVRVTPSGSLISEEEWARRRSDWLPTEDDHRFVASLMKRVIEPGKMAGWVAPPARGINSRPWDFEYVKFS